MTDVVVTIARYYREGGVPKVETVLWKWARSTHDDGRGEVIDPGVAARARPLPAAYDPGISPNEWVWMAADSPAAKLPRPTELIRGLVAQPDGTMLDTVDHVHAAEALYWSYYKLPLRAGVELVDEEIWRSDMEALATAKKAADEARAAEIAAAKQEREAHKSTARAKLSALGLTDAEISALGA